MVREVRNATDETPVIARVGGALRDPVGHLAAVVEQMIADAAVAAVNDHRLCQIGVRTRIVRVNHPVAVGVRPKPQAVELSSGDGDETGVGRGDVGLTVVVVSPRHDGAVGLETQGVECAGGYGDESRVG